MKEYLEKYLKRKIEVKEYPTKELPLMYSGLYHVYLIQTGKFEWVTAAPKGQITLRDLRSHIGQLENITGLDCAFCFDNVSNYIANALLDEGIAFVIINKQIYLPFAGMMVRTIRNASPAPVQEISFLTQKILLTALYEKWQGMNVTKIAEAMEVTKAAVSKSMNEIEYLNLPIVDKSGKSRTITVDKDIKQAWEQIRPVLRNPIIKRFELNKDYELDYKAGISALCEYSMLNENNYPTYGVLKKNIGSIDVNNNLARSSIGCEILELGYIINYKGESIMDPLSIVLSLSNREKEDERVSMAIEEMLEEHVW